MRATVFLRVLAVAVAGMGLYPLANALTAGAAVPWWDTVVRAWLLNGGAVIGVSLAAAILLGDRVDALAERAKALLLRMPPRLFAAVASVAAVVAAIVIAHRAFAGQPFTSDEMAQQWHARILLSGHLWAVAEPFPEFFNSAPVFDRDGRWFSQYPIGGPALIALVALVFVNEGWRDASSPDYACWVCRSSVPNAS